MILTILTILASAFVVAGAYLIGAMLPDIL